MRISTLAIVVLLTLIFSCKKKEEKAKPDFDRQPMLSNIGTNIIIPNYQSLKTSADRLDSMITIFNTNPDNTNLLNLQNIFKDAYRAWQLCSVFEFGPAETEYLRINVNTFPTDTTQIKSNISSGIYDLNTAANIDAKGFPGIDYLLFGIGADNNSILLKYTTDVEATNRKQYLAALSNELKSKTGTVLNAWGTYLNTFINASGTDIGSSVGQLVNQLDYEMDVIKNYKIGIPLGKQTLGNALPEKVEAYYSGISAELALREIKTIENIYLGRTLQGDGIGFDDYLVQIEAQYNGQLLSDVIKNQFSITIGKLQAIPDPLSSTIQSNPAIVDASYLEIQKLLVLLKTDLPSAIGVLITYSDNDGD